MTLNVSIVVICLNEANNIRSCLETLLDQTYPAEHYEIIVVDGGSTDGTLEIVEEVRRTNANLRLVVELKKGAAAGRNAGLKSARWEYVAFIDADCEAPGDWLETLVESFREARKKDDRICAVGGGNIPPETADSFPIAIGIALNSYLGSFNSVQGRRYGNAKYVESVSTVNALYENDKVAKVGNFDVTLGSEAEDADLNYRLMRTGYRFLYVPESVVWHKMRPTPVTWLKNMFRYGKGRARLLKRYPEMWALKFVLPLLFITVIFSIILIPFSAFFYLPMLYFPLIVLFSLFRCLQCSMTKFTAHVTLVYLIQHFGYGVGEIYGLFNPKVK